jgi:hypothetical protein
VGGSPLTAQRRKAGMRVTQTGVTGERDKPGADRIPRSFRPADVLSEGLAFEKQAGVRRPTKFVGNRWQPILPPVCPGLVTQRQIGLGQSINRAANGASSPVFAAGDMSKVWLLANVREPDAPSTAAVE